jgi:hypothetical protein
VTILPGFVRPARRDRAMRLALVVALDELNRTPDFALAVSG